MIKKIILLTIVIFVSFFLFSIKKSQDKIQSNSLQQKPKYLCDARTNCKVNPPKGVCVPGGTCTSS